MLEPQKGTIRIDEKILTEQNSRSWSRCIGYVPQQIFLSDNTVSANIAFGVNINDINQEAVEHAAKIANLNEFVINELPLKYQTIIGERGIRLSGGQRQRIGIARALYHKPKVLILDEATSALDNLTEKAVMNAIHNSENNITKILVAHRLSTVRYCDNIFLFDKGELINQGTFEELIKINLNGNTLSKDEYVVDDLKLSDLEKLKTDFKKNGTITSGNSSGINDGAAALLLTTSEEAKKNLNEQLAKIVS